MTDSKNKNIIEKRDIILSSVAKSRGMQWKDDRLLSLDGGITITENLNDAAKKLLGQTATYKDLDNSDSVIDYIIKLPRYEELVAEARETLKKQGIDLPRADQIETYTPGTGAWFRKILDKINESF